MQQIDTSGGSSKQAPMQINQLETASKNKRKYEPPSLVAICQLTMMVSMPFQLFHYDFVMGTDGEEEIEPTKYE